MLVVYNMCCVNELSSYSEILIWPFKQVCVVDSVCECFCRNRDGLLFALQQRAGAISSRSPGVMKGALHSSFQERGHRKLEGFQLPVFTVPTFTGEKEAGFDSNTS